MQPRELLEDYKVRAAEVARTLLQSVDDWDGTPICTRSPAKTAPLYSLRRTDGQLLLEWPRGSFVLTSEAISKATPDPLWESADGICRHMEQDHGDTFKDFLGQRGWQGKVETGTLMPWVEMRGFFLHSPDCLAWIPFPQECPTPNDVRKSMIKMLREIRHE
jgi:uncharacterized protein DUF2470